MNHLIFKDPFFGNNNICDGFKQISVRTWNLLGNAFEHDITVGEETITDINLLELKMRHPNLIVKKLTRHQEARIGADWIWAIIGKNGRVFLLYVQAKKLFPNERYNYLYHGQYRLRQVNRLIYNSIINSYPAYPIYTFYNYFNDNNRFIQCNCGDLNPIELYGCSIADAFIVRNHIVHGQNRLVDLLQHQYPWSCMFCCNGNLFGDFYNDSGSDDIFPFKLDWDGFSEDDDMATLLYKRFVNRRRIQEFLNSQEQPIERFSEEKFLLQETPQFLIDLLEGKKIKENPFKNLGVKRIVILKEE